MRRAGLIWALVTSTNLIPPHTMTAKIRITEAWATMVKTLAALLGKVSRRKVTAMCSPLLRAIAAPSREAQTRQ
jgi:hypothetical protein